MGYQAEQTVEKLDYDFRPFAEVHGTTPEPKTGQIKRFWLAFDEVLRTNRHEIETFAKRLAEVPEDNLDKRQAIEDEYHAQAEERTDRTRAQRIANIAAVCSNEPSVEELTELPGRVFDDFDAYMQDQLTPKGWKRGSN